MKVFIEKTNRGEIVEKTFRDKVVSFGDLDESTQKVLYHIRYQDGDEEVHDIIWKHTLTTHSNTHTHTYTQDLFLEELLPLLDNKIAPDPMAVAQMYMTETNPRTEWWGFVYDVLSS